jgi:hypothetical protein
MNPNGLQDYLGSEAPLSQERLLTICAYYGAESRKDTVKATARRRVHRARLRRAGRETHEWKGEMAG